MHFLIKLVAGSRRKRLLYDHEQQNQYQRTYLENVKDLTGTDKQRKFAPLETNLLFP